MFVTTAVAVVQFPRVLLFSALVGVERATKTAMVDNRTFSINRMTRDSPHSRVRFQFDFSAARILFGILRRLKMWQQKTRLHSSHTTGLFVSDPVAPSGFPVLSAICAMLCVNSGVFSTPQPYRTAIFWAGFLHTIRSGLCSPIK